MSERLRPPPPYFVTAIFVLVILLLYLPIFIMFHNSFHSSEGLTLSWYAQVFADEALISALRRSFMVSTVVALISTILGSSAAIALEKSSFRLKPFLMMFSTVSLIMPELVFALSLLAWFYVLQLELSLNTVIFAHVTFTLPFVMLTVQARLESFDISIEDAGRDLGASEVTILEKIVFPLLKPALVTSFILAFLLSFDDFLITFYTNGVGQDTLPIKLYSAMKFGLSPKLSALSSLMFCFTLIVIIILVRVQNMKELLKKSA